MNSNNNIKPYLNENKKVRYNEEEDNDDDENEIEENNNFKKKVKKVLIVIFIMTILYFTVQLILYGIEVSDVYPSLSKNMKTIDIMVKVSYFILTFLISYIVVKMK
jgi:hypothetical protein